jgi:mono/diheme cytochrome c family protein
VGKRSHRVFRYVIVAGPAALVLCLGIGVTASRGQAKVQTARSSSRSFSAKDVVPDEVALASASAYAFGPQDASQTSDAPVTSPSQPKKAGLPDGDGKQLATDYCQDCHSLTNITSARKLPDEWRETVMTMLDRGARLPPDKVDALVQYLAKNFAPKQATPAAAGATDAAPATPAVTPAPASSQTAELPDGDGKVLATQYCQTCHQLALVTKARKSADEWRQTVRKMVNYGSTLPQQDVDPLVRYFAKNLGAEK